MMKSSGLIYVLEICLAVVIPFVSVACVFFLLFVVVVVEVFNFFFFFYYSVFAVFSLAQDAGQGQGQSVIVLCILFPNEMSMTFVVKF